MHWFSFGLSDNPIERLEQIVRGARRHANELPNLEADVRAEIEHAERQLAVRHRIEWFGF
jgi:hypothetical protein